MQLALHFNATCIAYSPCRFTNTLYCFSYIVHIHCVCIYYTTHAAKKIEMYETNIICTQKEFKIFSKFYWFVLWYLNQQALKQFGY